MTRNHGTHKSAVKALKQHAETNELQAARDEIETLRTELEKTKRDAKDAAKTNAEELNVAREHAQALEAELEMAQQEYLQLDERAYQSYEEFKFVQDKIHELHNLTVHGHQEDVVERGFIAAIHQLTSDDINDDLAHVRNKMREKFGRERVDKRLKNNEWARWSLTAETVYNSPSLLDVGTGPGAFINGLARSKTIKYLKGIDIREGYSLYSQLYDGYERFIMDASQMSFSDNSFHTVTCMEVIEHVDADVMVQMIAELRRVAAKRLIISVPLCEPLPLPDYHRQRFTTERLKKLFPAAKFTLFLKSPVTSLPWMFIEERY